MTASKIASAVAVLGLTAITIPAFGQGDNDFVGLYGGVNVGPTRATIDDPRITATLVNNGFGVTSLVDDKHSTGVKVFGGYQLNRNWAVEGGVFSLGKFGYQATTTPAGTLSGEARIRGLNLDLVGTLPLTGQFSIFGRAGVTYAEARDQFRSTGFVVVANPNPRERATNWKAGLGLQYAFTPSLSVRAEVERYRINDAVGNKGDVNMASVGLVYRFGAPPVTASRAPTPAPVVAQAALPSPLVVSPSPAPAPEATAVRTPAPAPTAVSEKVTMASDTFFEFDKSILRPEGKAKIDELGSRRQGMALEAVIATGHTDSVGSDGYNDRLSLRRAEAVKVYLVATGTEASRIFVEGKGEKQPVADNATEDGRARNRRVQIEVVGTRTR